VKRKKKDETKRATERRQDRKQRDDRQKPRAGLES
jgi:hypothetical protein